MARSGSPRGEPTERPWTLGLDASTGVMCFGLLRGEELVAERLRVSPRGAGRRLLAELTALLAEEGLTPEDLDLIAVGMGPGSFTGIRVAMATARGLGWAGGVPVCGVVSLESLAAAAASDGALIAAALDARKGEVYGALYRAYALLRRPEPVVAPVVAAPEAFGEAVARAVGGQPVTWVGDGARGYADRMLMDAGRLAPPPLDAMRGAAVASLGRAVAAEDGPPALAALQPIYLRRSEAELNIGPPAGTSRIEALRTR